MWQFSNLIQYIVKTRAQHKNSKHNLDLLIAFNVFKMELDILWLGHRKNLFATEKGREQCKQIIASLLRTM